MILFLDYRKPVRKTFTNWNSEEDVLKQFIASILYKILSQCHKGSEKRKVFVMILLSNQILCSHKACFIFLDMKEGKVNENQNSQSKMQTCVIE